ncbi:hypothetical protein PoB_007068800 [Plakobranchus ocellatus]|uniref:Uncharacterized protein n=1 Tax=Plakobranchus ocellatus TaxID=259542 RepID=A0AAV4DJF2_9GAST|nr:hypothetical protein PoB_007068800 [Plakobranchus ocellatus]
MTTWSHLLHMAILPNEGFGLESQTPLTLLSKFSIWFRLMIFYSWEGIQQWFPLAYYWFVYGFPASLRLATNPQGSGDLPPFAGLILHPTGSHNPPHQFKIDGVTGLIADCPMDGV